MNNIHISMIDISILNKKKCYVIHIYFLSFCNTYVYKTILTQSSRQTIFFLSLFLSSYVFFFFFIENKSENCELYKSIYKYINEKKNEIKRSAITYRRYKC